MTAVEELSIGAILADKIFIAFALKRKIGYLPVTAESSWTYLDQI